MDKPVYSTSLVLQHLAAGMFTMHERSWVRSRINGDRQFIGRLRNDCARLPEGMRPAIDDLITASYRLSPVFQRASLRPTYDAVLALYRAFAAYTRAASVVRRDVAAREQWLLEYAVSIAGQLDEQRDTAMLRALTGRIRITQVAINAGAQDADTHRSTHVIYSSMVQIDAAITDAECLLMTPRYERAMLHQEVA